MFRLVLSEDLSQCCRSDSFAGVKLGFRFSAETNRRDLHVTEANNLSRGGTRLIVPMLILLGARCRVALPND